MLLDDLIQGSENHNNYMRKRQMNIRILWIPIALSLASACAMGYDEDVASFADDSEQIDHNSAKEGDVTKAAGDCSVSIQCSNAPSKSCNGTGGSCSASSSGYGKVTCNGSSYYCPNCSSNGSCNSECSYDPDCSSCVQGMPCEFDSQCGALESGFCKPTTGTCHCF